LDDVISKPFLYEALLEKIHEHLGMEYRCEGPAVTRGDVPQTCVPPTEVSAMGLAPHLRDAMERAIDACDLEGLARALPEVEVQSPELAAKIRSLAESYNYDALARVLGKDQ
jgi:hypothetical protein